MANSKSLQVLTLSLCSVCNFELSSCDTWAQSRDVSATSHDHSFIPTCCRKAQEHFL